MVLGLLLITSSQADDIRDFEIEGITIGDTMLKYYDKELINQRKADWPGSKKYTRFWDNSIQSEMYDSIQLIYLTNDSNYIIKGIVAGILYENTPISNCYNRQLEITEELKPLFPNTKIEIGKINKHKTDVTGKSTYKNIYFRFINGDTVATGCYNWSKKIEEEKNWVDHFRISIYDNNHKLWLQNEAYK